MCVGGVPCIVVLWILLRSEWHSGGQQERKVCCFLFLSFWWRLLNRKVLFLSSSPFSQLLYSALLLSLTDSVTYLLLLPVDGFPSPEDSSCLVVVTDRPLELVFYSWALSYPSLSFPHFLFLGKALNSQQMFLFSNHHLVFLRSDHRNKEVISMISRWH